MRLSVGLQERPENYFIITLQKIKYDLDTDPYTNKSPKQNTIFTKEPHSWQESTWKPLVYGIQKKNVIGVPLFFVCFTREVQVLFGP